MTEIIKIYNQYNVDIILTFIRIILGILLVLNTKKVSKNVKYGVVVTYYGIISWLVVMFRLNCSNMILGVGLLLVLALSFLIVKFHKTEHIVNVIFFFICFYILTGCIFCLFNINFSEILGIYNYDIDFKSIYIMLLISATLSVLVYIFVIVKKKFITILEGNNYFLIGNYFIASAFVSIAMFPIYGPTENREFVLVLLNVTDNFKTNYVLLAETIIILLYREYKKEN